jgi:predicted membrane channel-forming protein YqfA (hemolysin III family)
MFLQHNGPLVVGLIFIVFSLIATFFVWSSPREYGSPRWPLLSFFGGIGLRGVSSCLLVWHHPSGAAIAGTLSAGVLWFSVGAVLTQWFHEGLQQRRPLRR